MAKLTKLANFRQNFVKIAKIVMQIFIEAAKSEEDILSLSKMTKNESKNIGFKVTSLIFTFLALMVWDSYGNVQDDREMVAYMEECWKLLRYK